MSAMASDQRKMCGGHCGVTAVVLPTCRSSSTEHLPPLPSYIVIQLDFNCGPNLAPFALKFVALAQRFRSK